MTRKGQYTTLKNAKINLTKMSETGINKHIDHLCFNWDKKKQLVCRAQNLSKLIKNRQGELKLKVLHHQQGTNPSRLSRQDHGQIPHCQQGAVYNKFSRNLNCNPKKFEMQMTIGYLEEM